MQKKMGKKFQGGGYFQKCLYASASMVLTCFKVTHAMNTDAPLFCHEYQLLHLLIILIFSCTSLIQRARHHFNFFPQIDI